MSLAFLISTCFLGTVSAHPVLTRVYERTLVVRLSASAVTVEYQLDVDESTAIIDLMAVIRDGLPNLTTRTDLYGAYIRSYGPLLADRLSGTLDGKPLTFVCTRRNYQLIDHLRCDFTFQAAWEPDREQEHRFTFREGNFEGEAGLVKLSFARTEWDYPLVAASVVGLSASSNAAPLVDCSALYPGRIDASVRFVSKDQASEGLQSKSALDRTLAEEERLREAAATFNVVDLAPETLAAEESPLENAKSISPHNLLDLLLESRLGFWALLYIAAFFGAAHALTPGHGKTLVAAYLVGEQGTVWHAFLLGLVTTLTHTGAVLVLAAIMPLVFPNAVPAQMQFILGLGGGLLVAGMGIWLFLKRVSGQADHIHFGGHGSHHHHHYHGIAGHAHDKHGSQELPPKAPGRVGMGSLVILGMTGGIVPCWDAIVMFGLAVATRRLWLGLPLLLAFSAGLAAVLIAIGIVVVKAKRLAGSQWSESRLFRALPIISALLVMGMGLWLCYESLHQKPQSAVSSLTSP
ncbi:MAG: nickel/cobalt transporter [Gemmataceae bacterium]